MTVATEHTCIDATGLGPRYSVETDRKLVAALQAICSRNDQVARACNDAFHEATWAGSVHSRSKEAGVQELAGTFSPEVLKVLQRNADSLLELKKQHIADNQASRETNRKLMWWTSNNQQESTAIDGNMVETQQDAVKHGRFKFFQLPGSSVASGVAGSKASMDSGALKFWQSGMPAGSGLSRGFSMTPGTMDQQQLQKSLTAMLFGKNRRTSTSNAGATPISPWRLSDTAASWRSSDAGSRHSSYKSSDAGAVRKSVSTKIGLPGSVGPERQVGSLWASLAAGEGPLSKSHSMLAKPNTQAEQLVGKSLEIVAEDEREGHDSPQPGAAPIVSVAHNRSLVTTIRMQAAGGGRASSPIESFSFGNRVGEESHSPEFLRASVSSRQTPSALAANLLEVTAGTAGPLVRSSLALQSTRVDPFDAPEPQPQPFVEQMKAEDQAMKAGQAAASTGLMSALRRSLSGPARAANAVAGAVARATRTAVPEQAPVGPLVAGAGLMAQQIMVMQQQRLLANSTGTADEDGPTPGDNVEMLDLDASRAYAMGVHHMMQGVATVLSGSDTSSKPQTPRSAQMDHGPNKPAAASIIAMQPAPGASNVEPGPQVPSVAEIQPVQEQLLKAETRDEDSNLGASLEERLQQLEEQRSQRRLAPPSPALSPQASGLLSPRQSQQVLAPTAAGVPPGSRSTRRSNSATVSSRRDSPTAASAAAMTSAPSVTRGLPVMGQATMDILGRAPASLVQPERLSRPVSSSSSMRLDDVYQQTAGNLNPLSAGLSSIKRTSSYGTRPPRQPSTRISPRTSAHDAVQPGYPSVPAPGPLSAQHSSTMLNARRPQTGGGIIGPGENKGPSWGWQSLGLPTGPGAPPSDPAMDPAAYATGNKYAASWGLLDAATTAAAATPRNPLSKQASATGVPSRQASANGGLSRQQSAVMQGQMSRQNSAVSVRSPRSPFQQVQQQPVRQQWQQTGAAGRYAGPASITPLSQSPRSGRTTPGRSEPQAGNNSVAAAAAAVRGGQQAMDALQSRRISDIVMQDSDDEGFDTAEENSASSSYASSTGKAPSSVSTSGRPRSVARAGQVVQAKARESPVPAPPSFLTSAQAAVAAQWSPNKHASAMAQAPAFSRGALGAEVSDVVITEGQGLQPPGLSYLSPRQTTTAAAAGPSHSYNQTPVTGNPYQTPQQQAAYAGGYSVYSPTAPPAGPRSGPKQPGTAPARMASQQLQQQHVVTAVDIARSRSGIRRTSSSSSGGHVVYQANNTPGFTNGRGSRGGQPVAVSGAAASRAAYAQSQQYGKQRPHSGSARQPGGRKGYNDAYDMRV